MFKVVTILNAASGAPQYEYASANYGKTYKKGTLLYCNAGNLQNCTATDKPTHICMSDLKEAGLNEVITVIPITPDLVIETQTERSGSNYDIGSKYALLIKDGFAVGIDFVTSNGVATIHQNDIAPGRKRVRVRFV